MTIISTSLILNTTTMKFICLTFTILLSYYAVHSQTPPPPVDKSKMNVFKDWVGNWKGEGWIQPGPGTPQKSIVDEHIEYKLDGMIVTVEGTGKSPDDEGKIVHHAFAVLYYDQTAKAYKFRSFLKDGRNTDAWFEVTGENKYRWGFDVPTGKIAYTINLDTSAGKWNEIGEFSSDGKTWYKFFEMNLTRAN